MSAEAEAAAPSISMPRLIEAAGQIIDVSPMPMPAAASIWNRAPVNQQPPILVRPIPRKRGPKKRSNIVFRSVPSFQSITEVHAVATVSEILARMESERSHGLGRGFEFQLGL